MFTSTSRVEKLSFVLFGYGTFISKYTVSSTCADNDIKISKICFIPVQSNRTAPHQIPLLWVHPQQSQSSVTVFFHFHLTLDEVKAQYYV